MSVSTILEDISQALEVWSHRILDVEAKIKRVTDFRETLVGDLHRKVQDSIISEPNSRDSPKIVDRRYLALSSFEISQIKRALLVE